MGDLATSRDIRAKGPRGDDWRYKFLEILAQTGSDHLAAKGVGKSVQTARGHYRRFPAFRERWDLAVEEFVQRLEVEVASRALDRRDQASALLLMFRLKAEAKEKYREFYKDPAEREMLPVAAVIRLFEKFVAEEQAPAFLAEIRGIVDEQKRRGK